jgi:hypothetical protein
MASILPRLAARHDAENLERLERLASAGFLVPHPATDRLERLERFEQLEATAS